MCHSSSPLFFTHLNHKIMTEKTITICGKDVPILYCAATETGYERLSQKGIDVFLPTFGPNPDKPEETIMTAPPTANTEDYLQLAIAAIVALSMQVQRY